MSNLSGALAISVGQYNFLLFHFLYLVMIL